MDSFLVISNISEQLFQETYSDGCFLKDFFSRKQALESVRKAALKKFEKFLKKTSVGVYNVFIFSEQNHSTTHCFQRIL